MKFRVGDKAVFQHGKSSIDKWNGREVLITQAGFSPYGYQIIDELTGVLGLAFEGELTPINVEVSEDTYSID